MSCSGSRSAATPKAAVQWPFPPAKQQTCSKCGTLAAKFSTIYYATGPVTTCYTCEHPPVRTLLSGRGETMWQDLVLDHVQDETGQPLRVTSLRQLREAEKRYNFRHHAANHDQANWDKPPQQASGKVEDNVKWLYPELAAEMRKDPKIQREMKMDQEKLLGKLV